MSTDYITDHNTRHVLIIENSDALAKLYKKELNSKGYHVDITSCEKEAIQALNHHAYHLVVAALDLPGVDALEFLDTLQSVATGIPVIAISGQGSVNMAVNIIRQGARNYFIKPFAPHRLVDAIEKELGSEPAKDRHEKKPSHPCRPHLEAGTEENKFIGTSAIMQELYEKIEKAARSNANVFITGNSGTGKEVCANTIHNYSARKNGPFIPVNCAAIPRDLIESELFGHIRGAFTGAVDNREGAARLAHGGTLFLDEIGEINTDMQAKLLRFVQTLTFQKIGSSKAEKVDIRIICATNRDPVHEMRKGRFREDLFYRLHVIPLHMPPLKDRGDDVLDIAHAFLMEFGRQEKKAFYEIEPTAIEILKTYHWPGNIRQLQNIIRQCVIMQDGPVLNASMLLNALPDKPNIKSCCANTLQEKSNITPMPSEDLITVPRSLAEIEYQAIMEAIRQCNGNIPRAAAKLKISPSTIYRKKADWNKEQRA